MPQLQVVDFGQNAGSDALGNLARGLSTGYFQAQEKKRNDDIFAKIKEQYGDGDIMDFVSQIVKEEGFSQEYKKNLIDPIKTLSDLQKKKNATEYDEIKRSIALQDLNIKKSRAKREIPVQVSTYINNQLKGQDEELSIEDKSMLNSSMVDILEKDPELSIPQAFDMKYEELREKDKFIKAKQLTKRPEIFGATKSEKERKKNKILEEPKKQVIRELSELYEDGMTSKKDLRNLLKKALWTEEEEIQEILNAVTKKKRKEQKKEPESIDNILFG
jgi:hypothetical protein